MDQRQLGKPDIGMGEVSEDPMIRPVFNHMNNESISNLERVLAMNSITMQQTYPQAQAQEQEPHFKPIDITNGQYNAYLYNAMLQNYQQLQQQQLQQPQSMEFPTSIQQAPTHHGAPAQQQSVQGFPPFIQYPFLPFWTACPLPFSPMAYPQIIIPPAMATPQPVGPQLLRPVTAVPMSPPNFGVKHDYQPIRPKAVETKEEKLNRYKEKRSKRLWSRPPDQRLSQIAQERPRDQSGKFVSTKSTSERERELKDLKAELSEVRQKLQTTERELSMLKRDGWTNDDMYLRQVMQNQYHQYNQALQEQCAQQGVIYSPFRGGNTAVQPFKEKIDFKERKTALKKIDSPYLTEIEKQQLEYQRQQLKSQSGSFIQPEMEKHTMTEHDGWVEELLNTASSSDDEDMNLG